MFVLYQLHYHLFDAYLIFLAGMPEGKIPFFGRRGWCGRDVCCFGRTAPSRFLQTAFQRHQCSYEEYDVFCVAISNYRYVDML